MGNIVLLDELTINKIAAGEVIERPASVVKEMLENSIDAGATNINIEIQNGGISKIRITDNGKGIEVDDMRIAFERHATSKIREANDLETVRTMGFRGEALASIAAISRIEMVSRTASNETGYKIVVEAGNIIQEEMVACSIGTTITVEKLFFNTPVRYKFLKKDYTESGYIEDAVTRLALINTNIAIKLINSGKVVIQTLGNGDMKSVIYSIYGKDIAEGILDVNYQFEDMKITGIVGKPEIARSNKTNQMFFVNKRFVKDKTLSAAADQAFKGMLPIGKFGFLILNIDMNPKKVDVNVHPAKLEVRFAEESNVFKGVMYGIKEGLLSGSLVSNVSAIEGKHEGKIEGNHEGETQETQETQEFRSEIKLEGVKQGSKRGKRLLDDSEVVVAPIVSGVTKIETNLDGSSQIEEKPEKKQTKGIIDLFKKVSKEKTNISVDSEMNNLIEELYNKRQNPQVTTETIPVNMGESIEEEKVKEDDIEENIYKINIEEELERSNITKQGGKPEAESLNKESYIPQIDEIPNSLKNFMIFGDTKRIENEEKVSVTEETGNVQETENTQETRNIEEFVNIQETSNTEHIVEAEIQENTDYIVEGKNPENTEHIVEAENFENTVEIRGVQEAINNEIESKVAETPETYSGNEKTQEAPIVNEETQVKPEFEEMYRKTFGEVPASLKKKEEKFDDVKYADGANISVFTKNNETVDYKYIGTAFTTYIMLEIGEELYLLDQHAAHERIMYEKVKRNFYNDNKDSQIMLLPDIITLTNKEMWVTRENISTFEKAGFVLEEFGENTIKLVGVPNICINLDTKTLFLDILDEIDTVARTERQEIEEKFIATIACKAAVKANMNLEEMEVNELLRVLMRLPNPFTCPHGRPTAIKMVKSDIEKKFSRR